VWNPIESSSADVSRSFIDISPDGKEVLRRKRGDVVADEVEGPILRTGDGVEGIREDPTKGEEGGELDLCPMDFWRREGGVAVSGEVIFEVSRYRSSIRFVNCRNEVDMRKFASN